MRRANATSFQAAVDKFSLRIVDPILVALAKGDVSSLSAECVAVLDGNSSGSKSARSLLNMQYWVANGLAVMNDYRVARGWLRQSPLSALPPSSTASNGQVKMLFDAFYSVGFSQPDVWQTVVGLPLSKQQLCEMFFADIGHAACCYCDIDTVRTRHYLEHFVPRSKLPFLSVDSWNLYLACESCNSTQLGKGVRVRWPIDPPCGREYGKTVDFGFANGVIEVSSRDATTASFVELMHLDHRYGNDPVYSSVITRVARVRESFTRLGPLGMDPVDYHRSMYEQEALLYVCEAALKLGVGA